MKKQAIILIYTTSVLLAACGGESSTSSRVGENSNTIVSGFASAGAALTGSQVSAVCSNGTGKNQTTITDNNGAYSLEITDGTLPCLVSVRPVSTTITDDSTVCKFTTAIIDLGFQTPADPVDSPKLPRSGCFTKYTENPVGARAIAVAAGPLNITPISDLIAARALQENLEPLEYVSDKDIGDRIKNISATQLKQASDDVLRILNLGTKGQVNLVGRDPTQLKTHKPATSTTKGDDTDQQIDVLLALLKTAKSSLSQLATSIAMSPLSDGTTDVSGSVMSQLQPPADSSCPNLRSESYRIVAIRGDAVLTGQAKSDLSQTNLPIRYENASTETLKLNAKTFVNCAGTIEPRFSIRGLSR